MKHETKAHILFLTLPSFLAVIFAVIYSWGIWPSFQLTSVNVLCVALIALELAQAFTERINTWKVCGFIGSGAISGIATALNVLNDVRSGVFTLGQLSFWGWLWIGLLAISGIALVVILIRILRWNQEQWEEIRMWRQKYRKERMEARRQLRLSKQTYMQELSKEKATAKIDKQKDRAGKDTIVRNQKHEQRMERLKDWKKQWDNITASVLRQTKLLGAFVATIMMALLFLVIPCSEKLQSIAFNWFDAVNKLASRINILPLDNEERFFQAFANYIIFYIFLIVAIWLLVFLCRYIYKVLTNSRKPEKELSNSESKNFLEEYDTAIAVLTVFTALMFALGTSESPFIDLTDKWTTLFTVILFILVVFVSVEIVRLVVEQIGQKNSLLKQLVRLIFVAILEFLAGLLLGVIINFQIEKVISSLLTMMFPNEELSFANKVQEKFNKMFNKELGDDGDEYPTLGFSKKQIWRRYHKK
ncbi:hypothetical protein D3Z55_17630 [Clostridiaceae bacterium]|nr:hypothetical protein [Clostridiaceae bacterium]